MRRRTHGGCPLSRHRPFDASPTKADWTPTSERVSFRPMANTTSVKPTGRLAGVLYVLGGVPSVFSYLYMPGALYFPDDPAKTALHVAAAPLTFRLAIVGDVAGQVLLILLGLALYNLLEDVDRRYARAMLVLVVVAAAFEFANVLNLFGALVAWRVVGSTAPFTEPQLNAFAVGFLRLRESGLNVAQIFWGLWLFPFGVLVYRSRLFPRILGALLVAACIAYVAASVALILAPTPPRLFYHVMQGIGGFAEAAMGLWLLIVGAKRASPAVEVDTGGAQLAEAT